MLARLSVSKTRLLQIEILPGILLTRRIIKCWPDIPVCVDNWLLQHQCWFITNIFLDAFYIFWRVVIGITINRLFVLFALQENHSCILLFKIGDDFLENENVLQTPSEVAVNFSVGEMIGNIHDESSLLHALTSNGALRYKPHTDSANSKQ